MSDTYARYNTYSVEGRSSARRLSDALNDSWITTRQKRSDALQDDNDAECSFENTGIDADTILNWTDASADQADEDAGEDPDQDLYSQPYTANEEHIANEVVEMPYRRHSSYGCLYHTGTQRLVITQSHTAAAVCFGSHNCLCGIQHTEGDETVTVTEGGDYEVVFELRVLAKVSAPVTFSLCRENEALPGGVFVYMLSAGIRECRGSVMAHINAGDRIKLVISSITACEVLLAGSGVSATILLKRLD